MISYITIADADGSVIDRRKIDAHDNFKLDGVIDDALGDAGLYSCDSCETYVDETETLEGEDGDLLCLACKSKQSQEAEGQQ